MIPHPMEQEYQLHIMQENGDVHSVDAPADLRASEFLADVVEGLALKGEWEIYDKDIGRRLDPGRTLSENGVRSQHHLFLKAADPVYVNEPAPRPTRRSWNWAALGLVPLAVLAWFVGYSNGSGKTAPPPTVQGISEDSTALRQKVEQLEKDKNELEKKLTEPPVVPVDSNRPGADAKVAELTRSLYRANRDLTVAQTRITALESEVQVATKQAADARAEADRAKDGSGDVRRQLQAAQARLEADQAVIANLRRELSQTANAPRSGVVEWRGKVSKRKPIEINGNSSPEGRVIGSLPSTPYRITIGNPDKIRLLTPPSSTNWPRIVFESSDGGNMTIVFFWTTG